MPPYGNTQITADSNIVKLPYVKGSSRIFFIILYLQFIDTQVYQVKMGFPSQMLECDIKIKSSIKLGYYLKISPTGSILVNS